MSSRCLKRSTDFWKMQTNQRKADTSWSSALSLHPMENTNNLGDDVLSTFQNWPLQIRWWFSSPTFTYNIPLFWWSNFCQLDETFTNFFRLFSTFTKISDHGSRQITASVSGGWYVAVNVSQGGFRVFMASSSSELSSCTTLGKSTCRARLQTWAVVVENKHLEVNKNMEKERSSNFWKIHLIKSCSCILTGCLFRPVEYKP